MRLTHRQKRLLVNIRNGIKQGILQSFQFSLDPRPPKPIISRDPAANIARYWNRTGSYLRNAMDKTARELPEDGRQMNLFGDDCDAQSTTSHERTANGVPG